MAGDLEERRGEADDPAQDEQQADAHPHRRDDADPADEVALTLGQLARDDRDEDDVVDAQDDLEGGQRQQGDPGLGVGQDLHVASIGSYSASVGVGRVMP